MKFLEKLFGKKEKLKQEIIMPKKEIQQSFSHLSVHPDLIGLLWLVDGPQKNYTPKNSDEVFEYNGIRISFSSFSSHEPSLMSVKLPIKEVINEQNVDRPPYFPSYAGLSDEQRGVYWKLLENPYSGIYDIGYVFVLYYGLERHLLEGNFEDAFRVILKLRDTYDNKSFQSYSGCSMILTCLNRQRPDLAMEFYRSLDKDYEFNFSDNLYLLCKIGLQLPLTASDIMRMAQTFEFSKQNYIKKYPDLFINNLIDSMKNNIGSKELDISKYVTASEWKKLRKESVPIFANTSIRNQSVDIPLISDNFKLKKVVYDLLDQTHNKVKLELAKMRKDGTAPATVNTQTTKNKEVLSFDSVQESELLKELKNSQSNALYKHFALIALQNFYYKYRLLDEKYLQLCIDYCNMDLSLLPQMQEDYIKEEKSRILSYSNIYSKKELEQQLAEVTLFNGNIPAFKRLAIILEKQKDYQSVIDVCNKAINYYKETNQLHELIEFEKRIDKIQLKITKS